MACLVVAVGAIAQTDGPDPSAVVSSTPAALAQQQLDGYNNGDIEAFLKPYSDDVRVYSFPDTLLYTGKAEMRSRYAKLFSRRPNLRCEILKRTVLGRTVIDHERITGYSQNGPPGEAIAIYRVTDGRIVEVYFIGDERSPPRRQ